MGLSKRKGGSGKDGKKGKRRKTKKSKEGTDTEEESDERDRSWGSQKREKSKKLFKEIICNDGFQMSVQASKTHFCTPRENNGPYSHVEVGYPNELETLLLPYADGPRIVGMRPMLYVNVPAEVVEAIITKHSVMMSGQLPELVTRAVCAAATAAAGR